MHVRICFKKVISKKSKERAALKLEIDQLSEKRAQHIKQELKAQGGAKDSLDDQIFATVREQASSKGLVYDSDSVKY